MIDRFEAWWSTNPARQMLSPEAIQAGPPRAGMTERKPYAGMTVQVKLPFPPPYRRVPCQPVGLDEVPEDLPRFATRGKGTPC